jgi:hypothetical protein
MFDEHGDTPIDADDDGLTDDDIREMLKAMMGDVEKEIEREQRSAADTVSKRPGSWMSAVGRKRTK